MFCHRPCACSELMAVWFLLVPSENSCPVLRLGARQIVLLHVLYEALFVNFQGCLIIQFSKFDLFLSSYVFNKFYCASLICFVFRKNPFQRVSKKYIIKHCDTCQHFFSKNFSKLLKGLLFTVPTPLTHNPYASHMSRLCRLRQWGVGDVPASLPIALILYKDSSYL
jgi:hypothetical protein